MEVVEGEGEAMKKIVVVCNSGLGTSLMIRLNLEALLKEIGLKAWVEHTDVTTVDTLDADLIVGYSYIIDSLDTVRGTEKIGLDDLIDREHLKSKMFSNETFKQWIP